MADPVLITHEGYLEILITALGVVAAIFSFLFAVLGFVGYSTVKQSAIEAAEKAASEKTEAIVKQQVAAYTDERIKALVADAFRSLNDKARLEEQALDLTLGQAEAHSRSNLDMDNIVIRPVKRVVRDANLRKDEP